MESSFYERVRERLLSSEFATEKTKETEDYIENLTCPACRDETAYAHREKPFAIICNRANRCGAKTKTLDLFPDLVRNIEDEFRPTAQDQNRPATEYLRRRGLSKAMVGLNYSYSPKTREGCGGGVAFSIGKIDGRESFNIRLFNPPRGEGKTHNIGKQGGLYWQHPGITYDPDKPTYVTEGIIDALSLIEMGLQSIAVLTSGRDPGRLNLAGFKKLVLAFDNDEAGGKAFKRWKAFYPEAALATLPDGDWNDLLQRYPSAEEAGAYISENRDILRGLAELWLCGTASEYADKFREIYDHPAGIFEFDGETFCGNAGSCDHLGAFTLGLDHVQVNERDREQAEYRYRLKVCPKKGRPKFLTLRGMDMGGATSFKQALLGHGRVIWKGKDSVTTKLIEKLLRSPAPDIRQLDRVGYDALSGCYIFKDFAIGKDGEVLLPNSQGFFELGFNRIVRPDSLQTIVPEPGLPAREIYRMISEAWGERGEVGVTFFVAGWFVNQIKAEIGFFPILSNFGDPVTGKTMLMQTLNALQCLDEEGVPLHRTNTTKGITRTVARVSGLVKAVIEGNREKSTKFDPAIILPLYNQNSLQIRAETTNDNQVNETPFLAALAFSQNVELTKTSAEKSRLISVRFAKEDIAGTEAAFTRVRELPKRQLAHFFVEVMSHRRKFETEWHDRFVAIAEALKGEIPEPRIRENHALILAFHEILVEVIGVESDLRPFVVTLAKRKMTECETREVTLADLFLDAVMGLEGEDYASCCKLDPQGRLQIQLNKAIKVLNELKAGGFALAQLQTDLQDHPAFIKNKHSSRHFGKSGTHVWLFDADKISPREAEDTQADEDDNESSLPF